MRQVSTSSARPTVFSYNPALDGVRAFAVLGVMLFHAGLPLAANGSGGVLVFFVLSGFLITSLLLVEWFGSGQIDLGRFYVRRFLRLYPALLLLLIVTVGVVPLFGRVPTPTGLGVVSVLFYFSNWIWPLTGSSTDLGYLAHLWSLSVEEQFYLLWPAVMIYMLGRRNASGNLLLVAAAVAFLALLARVVLGLHYQFGFATLGTDTEADQLMFGCALAVAAARYPQRLQLVVRRWAWPAIAVMVVMLAPWRLPAPLIYLRDTAGLVVFGLAAAALIGYLHFASPRSIAARILSFTPIVLTGRISYGLYLWHMPVFEIVSRVLHSRSTAPGQVLLEFAISFGLAIASFAFLERPLLRLKDRLKTPVRRTASVVAAREPG